MASYRSGRQPRRRQATANCTSRLAQVSHPSIKSIQDIVLSCTTGAASGDLQVRPATKGVWCPAAPDSAHMSNILLCCNQRRASLLTAT